jgi:NAD(P)-dependent dehydrogenase (short-subunit alcohol dehydrogenase family)
MQGKQVLITGGSSGIGAATARLMASRGATVLIADLDQANGESIARELGPAHRFVQTNVGEAQSWKSLGDLVRKEWGKLDLAFLNAGAMSRPSGAPMFDDPFKWMTGERLARNISVNILGVVLGLETTLPLLAETKDGTLLITASSAAITVNVHDPYYTMSKYAALGYARAMAPLCAEKGVRVAAICPLAVDTNMTPSDLKEGPKAVGRKSSSVAEMAQSICDIYEKAAPGDVWVAGGGASPFRHEFAPLKSQIDYLASLHPSASANAPEAGGVRE